MMKLHYFSGAGAISAGTKTGNGQKADAGLGILAGVGLGLAIPGVFQAVAAMEIPHAAGVLRMTVSAGLALHLPGDMVEQTLERADQALYTAKSLGRNRVVVAPSGPRAARASAASS